MSPRTEILFQQRQWAEKRGLNPDSRGYLGQIEDNLFQALLTAAKRAFELGSGDELSDAASRPAKMKALHSSSALAVNFFGYWSENDPQPLARALNFPADIQSIQFEAQYPTGLSGNSLNIDVVLNLNDGHVIGLESKFTEWLSCKPGSKEPFKNKYFDCSSPLWSSVNLPKCPDLAVSLPDRSVAYRYLDAPQLLKHALGLGVGLDGGSSLYYSSPRDQNSESCR